MAVVSSLFRYPVKGFTPEPRSELVVQDDGRIAGDRVLAFRFADATDPEDADGLDSWPKSRGLALMDFPSLARVQLVFDADTSSVRMSEGNRVLADAALDDAGRQQLEAAITAFVERSSDARLLQRPGVLPLRLVGDGVTSRFQDRARGYVSLYTDGYAPMVLSTEMQDPVAAFATGYCSVWPSGPPTLKDFARRADLIPADKWSTARLPGPNGYGAVSGLSASLCVSTQTKRPREAWALVNHLTSVESELDYQRLIGNLPARTDAWGAPQLALPVLQPFAEQTRALSVTPNVIEWERIQIEIQSAAERVIRGVQTLDAALAALDERVDRLLAKRRALLDRGAIT